MGRPVLCKEMLASLSGYIDGELESQLCAEIDHHMAQCGDCRVVVDTLRKTVTLYRQHGHANLPGDAKARLYTVLNLSPRA